MDAASPEMTGVDTRIVDVGPLRLHVAVTGPESGPLAILLHGFPEFWYGWRHQLGPLAAAGFRVVAPDMRGYNLSDKPRSVAAYALDKLAGDVDGLARALGRSVIDLLIGHDWGAAVAWHVAQTRPSLVRKTAVLNVPHLKVMRRTLLTDPGQLRRSWYALAFQLPVLPERLFGARGFAAGIGALRTAREGSFRRADLDIYKGAWAQQGAPRAMLNYYRAAARHGPDEYAHEKVPGPLRIIWGTEDAFLKRKMARASLAYCEQGELFEIEGATHWVQHDAPDEVNRLLLDFAAQR